MRQRAATLMARALCASAASSCGTAPETAPSTADRPSPTATSTPFAVSLEPLPSPEGTQSEYATSVFAPSFTVTIPAGWTVAERASDVVQIYQRCDACAHGGEEHGEITLDMTAAESSIEEAIADLQTAVGIDPSPAVGAQVGTLTGQSFVATRSEATSAVAGRRPR